MLLHIVCDEPRAARRNRHLVTNLGLLELYASNAPIFKRRGTGRGVNAKGETSCELRRAAGGAGRAAGGFLARGERRRRARARYDCARGARLHLPRRTGVGRHRHALEGDGHVRTRSSLGRGPQELSCAFRPGPQKLTMDADLPGVKFKSIPFEIPP